LVYFGGPWNGKFWYIVWPSGIIYTHWINLIVIWYNLCPVDIPFFLSKQIWQP
jgi:hypothetical protein